MHPNVPRPPGWIPPEGPRSNGGAGTPAGRANGVQEGPRPWDAFLLAAAALLLIAHARLHVFVPGASAFRPALLVGVIGLGLWVIQKSRVRSPKAVFGSPIARIAGLFVIWAMVGIPFSLSVGGSGRFLLDSFSRTFLVFLIVVAAVRNLEDLRRMVGVMALGVGVFAFFAPLQRRGRAFSAGGYDPNDAAMLLVTGFPLMVYFALFGRRIWVRAASAAGGFLSLAAIVDTQSRGGFVALVAVIGFMIFLMKGVKPILRVAVVAVVVLVSIPLATTDYWDRMQTIQELDDGYGASGVGGRRNIWGRAIEYTVANPLTGVGINQFSRAEGQHPAIQERIEAGIGTKFSVAHSTWFQVMAETGIPGFLLFVALWIAAFRMLRRIQGSPPRGSPLSPRELSALAGFLMAALIGALAAGSFLTHGFSSLIWGPVALVVGLAKVLGPNERTQPPRRGSGATRRRTAGVAQSWAPGAAQRALRSR